MGDTGTLLRGAALGSVQVETVKARDVKGLMGRYVRNGWLVPCVQPWALVHLRTLAFDLLVRFGCPHP